MLYGSLSVINFWFLITKISKLEQKGFFILMFCLLQVCYAAYIFEHIDLLTFNSELAYYISYDLFYSMNEMVHAIFVMKYWILSKKVNSHWFQTVDRCY